MEPGDKARVYGHPQTDSFYQGVATLRHHLSGHRWLVRFDSGGRVVTRIVLEKHLTMTKM